MSEFQFPPLSVPARELPVPDSLSPGAKAALAGLCAPPIEMPDLQDVQGWIDWIANVDRETLAMMWPIAQQIPLSREVEIHSLGTARVLEITPPGASGDLAYLTIHGGGLIACGGDVCQAMSIFEAVLMGEKTWAVDYRMPPNDPYPAGLDDCLIAYEELLKLHKPGQIVVSGASAGANLAAAMLLKAGDAGLPMPAGLLLISPEVDLTESGDSFKVNLGVDSVLQNSLMPMNLLYADGHDLTHPYLSPLFGDYNRPFPPTYITSGTRDLFLSNAVRMHRVLRQANIPAELHVFEATPHGLALGPDTPEQADFDRERLRFAREAWGLT